MQKHRRGSIYIMTLGTALIVGMLAAAGLLAVRTQRRHVDLTQDMLQARLNAQTGLEMALFRFESTPDWRAQLATDAWNTDATTGYGTYRFAGIDPEDGDLLDGEFDPVLLTATGGSRSAVQKIEVRLKIRHPGMNCLKTVIHSKGDLVFDSTDITGNRAVSSDGKLSATNGSQVYVDAEAKGAINASGGSVFHADTTNEGDWPREMPAAPFAYCLANGTPIDASDLPLCDAQLLTNVAMADATNNWSAFGSCTLTLNTDQSQTQWCILVDGRSGPMDGPSQDITNSIQSGETYAVTADAKAVSGSMHMRLSLQTVSTGGGTQFFSGPWVTVGSSAFATVAGSLTPTWTGSLIEAKWFLESEASSDAFKFDDAGLRVANAPAGTLAIHRTVLSPNSNPFGAGTTNPQGIYVVDCGGDPISIKDCRIVGTLVILGNDKTDSILHGSINLAPVIESQDPSDTNLPILLLDKDFCLSTSDTDLDEGLANVNCNPTGTPYEGSDDSDKEDTYPSLLNGLVYAKGNLSVTSSLRLHGVMVVAGKATFTEATVNATYNPIYYWDNAPPDFQTDPVIELVPGTFRQKVD